MVDELMEPLAESSTLGTSNEEMNPRGNFDIFHCDVGHEGCHGTKSSEENTSHDLQGNKAIFYTPRNLNYCDVTSSSQSGEVLDWISEEVYESPFYDTLGVVRLHKDQTLVVSTQTLVDPLDDKIDYFRKNDLCPSSASTYNLNKVPLLSDKSIHTLVGLGRKFGGWFPCLNDSYIWVRWTLRSIVAPYLMRSFVEVLFVAGSETTSMTIQWAMQLLLAHPEAYHKLRGEIDSKVGNECFLNESDLTMLPYLHCVVNETLRLYPPVPLLLPHFSLEDCTVDGYNVPKHMILMANAWAIHRDPKLWDEPEKFKPKRFEAMEGEKEGFNYKFVPFGMGRRACPGAAMGMRSASLVLGSLVQWFDWRSVEFEQNLDACYNSTISLNNDKPFEAICIPRQNCIWFLDQL
ncbi:putative MFP1 attachment factor 1-like [Capsicum annuum]|nr:putative MFP1 attachment factor 1-like [Capsicum annuum]